ncbi:MAG: hypothetical protein WAN97_03255, partial [Candidatus Acidiferrales bacterium]
MLESAHLIGPIETYWSGRYSRPLSAQVLSQDSHAVKAIAQTLDIPDGLSRVPVQHWYINHDRVQIHELINRALEMILAASGNAQGHGERLPRLRKTPSACFDEIRLACPGDCEVYLLGRKARALQTLIHSGSINEPLSDISTTCAVQQAQGKRQQKVLFPVQRGYIEQIDDRGGAG